MKPVYLNHLSQLSMEGMFRSDQLWTSWETLGVDHEDHVLPKLKSTLFFDGTFAKFGRMDPYSQWVLAVSKMTLDQAGEIEAMILGSSWGSIYQDKKHVQAMTEQRVSPSLFTYTLPSVVLGEVAITLGSHHENVMVEAGEISGLQALSEAYWMIQSGRCRRCLVVAADYLDEKKATAWAGLLSTEVSSCELTSVDSFFDPSEGQRSKSDDQNEYREDAGMGDGELSSLRDFVSGDHRETRWSRRVQSSLGHGLEMIFIRHGENCE